MVHRQRLTVSGDPNLISGHASVHVVTLSRLALAVLNRKHGVHEDGTTEKADNEVGQDSTVSSPVPWSFFGQVDVGADNTILGE